MRCLMWVHSGAGGARSAARTTAPISGLLRPGASDEDTEAFLSVLNEGMLEADYGRARSPHTYHSGRHPRAWLLLRPYSWLGRSGVRV